MNLLKIVFIILNIIIIFNIVFKYATFAANTEISSADTADIYEDIWHKPNADQLFETFITSQEHLINHPMISPGAGLSQNRLPSRISQYDLGTTNNFSLEYGFVRLDSAENFPRLLNYSSEYAFIELNSNQYGFFRKTENKLYDNEFGFGLGMRSGMGYKLNTNNIYLLHSSAFLWTYFDYGNYVPGDGTGLGDFFNTFDNNYKFGWKGAATLSLKASGNFYIDFSYEHDNIFSDFEFTKWAGSWLIDNILQRWIDFLDPIFIDELQNSYPFFKFVYKNAVSIILSELRNSQQYYPFKSRYSLLQRRAAVQFRFIF